jgi:hypothetical protein
MKIKSTVAGIIATLMVALFVPSQAAWARHCSCSMDKCSGVEWHMVSNKCNIGPALTWQQYYSGGYTQPVPEGGLLFFR